MNSEKDEVCDGVQLVEMAAFNSKGCDCCKEGP